MKLERKGLALVVAVLASVGVVVTAAELFAQDDSCQDDGNDDDNNEELGGVVATSQHPSTEEDSPCKQECTDEYNSCIDVCRGLPTRKKRCLCYAACMEDYAKCLKNCPEIQYDKHYLPGTMTACSPTPDDCAIVDAGVGRRAPIHSAGRTNQPVGW